jgi:hypothetical protein
MASNNYFSNLSYTPSAGWLYFLFFIYSNTYCLLNRIYNLYVSEISYGSSSFSPVLDENYYKNATMSRSNDATSKLTILPPLTANNKSSNENKSTLVFKENEYYSLDFKFTGIAVMIGNYKFTNEANNFPDQIAHKDIENFETLKKFNFNTNCYLNQNKKLIDYLIARCTGFDYTDYACLFFCMSSHGSQHTIMSSDCIQMDIFKDIIEPFYKVESLKNKPKIFLFDCCRGRETMNKADFGAVRDDHIDKYQNKPMRNEKEWKFADFSNFFFAYSTVINFVSELSFRRGSHFMSAFFEVLNNHGKAEDWYELQRKVAKLMDERHKLVPEFVIRSKFKLAFVKLEKKVNFMQISFDKYLQEHNEKLQQIQLQQKQQQNDQQEMKLMLQQALQTKQQQILQPTQTIVNNII